MIPKTSFDVSSVQVTQHAINICKIEGYFISSTALSWLQVHDLNGTPAANAVPLKEYPLSATSEFYKDFHISPLVCNNGCFVGLSTTEGTYTASTDVMDISVELTSMEEPTGTTFTGALSPVNLTTLQVWSEASGLSARKKLYSLEASTVGSSQAAQYLMIFAKDTVNVGDIPFTRPLKIVQQTAYTGPTAFKFGELGMEVFSNDNTTTPRLGCTIMLSSSPTSYQTATGVAGIKAEYK